MQGYTKNQPLDTDPLLSANSDYIAPSQSAVKAALDTKLGNVTDTSLTGTGVVGDPLSTAGAEYIYMPNDPGTVQLTSANKSVLIVSLGSVAGTYILKLPDTSTLVPGRKYTIYLASALPGRTLEIQSYTGSIYVSSVHVGTCVTIQTNPVGTSLIRLTEDHNLLGNLQGGTDGEYYHLRAAQVTALHAAVTLATDTGLSISGQALTMGTPGTLTGSTTDAVTGSSHTHAISLPSTSLTDVTGITAFTPVIVGTSTAGTGTYTTQQGHYYIIGKMVYVQIRLVWTAHTGTGNMRINGLPVAVANLGYNPQLIAGWSGLTLLAVGNKLLAPAVSNNTYIFIQEIGGGANSSLPMAGNTAGTLNLNGWYMSV